MKTISISILLFSCFLSFGQNEKTDKLTIDTLFFYFEVNSDEYIKNETSEKSGEILRNQEYENVQIFACTDTTGTIGKNNKLAKKRLQNIEKNTPFSTSVKVEKIVVGESDQFNLLAKNRCVYIIITTLKVKDKKPILKREKITLHLSFVPGESDLLSSSYPILNDLFHHLDSISYSKIELHGHVCCGDDYNLSLMRAKTVEKQFIKHGEDVTKIKCFGYSNTQPLVAEITDENKQKNRRVEVIIYP